MSATAQHTSTPAPAEKPSRADTLRTIATWLDEHPGADVDVIALYDNPVTVDYLAIDGPQQVNDIVTAAGGTWTRQPEGTRLLLEQDIAPGIVLRVSRAYLLSDLKPAA